MAQSQSQSQPLPGSAGSAGEREVMGPGEGVCGEGDELEPELVGREVVQRHVPQPGVLDAADPVSAKVNKGHAEMIAATIRPIFAQPAHRGSRAADNVAYMLQVEFPAVAQLLLDGKTDLTAFADFPQAHWRKFWSKTATGAT